MVLGLALLANGLFMLVAPESWYWTAPGVQVRGSFNQHFVRDTGIQYMLIGVAFVYGTLNSRYRLLLWWLPTAWLAGLTQHRCNAIANALNNRPRKRLGYRSPEEILYG